MHCGLCRKEGWMRMDTCNVRIMDGPLVGADLALGFLRLLLQVLKLVLLNPRELALLSSQQWCLKVFSLCGLMKMAGTEPIQLNPLGNERNDLSSYLEHSIFVLLPDYDKENALIFNVLGCRMILINRSFQR